MENIVSIDSRRTEIVVHSYDALCESVAAHPERLVVLQEHVPLTAELLQRYAVGLGGVLEARGFGMVRSVRYDAAATTSTAQSLRALAMHSDGSFLECPPSRFLLGCVQHDQGGGGINTFIHVDDLLECSPTWVITALLKADLRFLQTYDGDLSGSVIAQALWRNSDGRLRIRWRSDDLYRPQVIRTNDTRAEDAVLWLHEFLQSTKPRRYAARAGETLVVPNTVMLHGRTALSPHSDREMLRVWVI